MSLHMDHGYLHLPWVCRSLGPFLIKEFLLYNSTPQDSRRYRSIIFIRVHFQFGILSPSSRIMCEIQGQENHQIENLLQLLEPFFCLFQGGDRCFKRLSLQPGSHLETVEKEVVSAIPYLR